MSVKQENKSNKAAEEENDISQQTATHEESPEAGQTESGSETDHLIQDQHNRILELEEELQRVKDTQLRKAAEIENIKKRIQRERDQFFTVAKETAIQDFLPISDDLQRTLAAMKEEEGSAGFIDGVRLVANKFDDVLEKHGVTRIDETGVPFDVDLHDALMRQKPQDDDVESGTVLQIVENGYRMGDKTLRHAKVIVSE